MKRSIFLRVGKKTTQPVIFSHLSSGRPPVGVAFERIIDVGSARMKVSSRRSAKSPMGIQAAKDMQVEVLLFPRRIVYIERCPKKGLVVYVVEADSMRLIWIIVNIMYQTKPRVCSRARLPWFT
jgi:hypothetical protein